MVSWRKGSLFVAAAVVLAACGGSIDKPKKQASNNGSANNGSANNGSNNGASNNGSSNNGANNGTSNNGTSNNGSSNNGTPTVCLDAPDSLNFGIVAIGNSATRFLELANCGAEAISISDISTTDGYFVIETPSTTLAPGASAQGTVEFAPEVIGSIDGQLTMQTSIGAVSVTLTGVGASDTEPICPDSVARVRESSSSTTNSYNATIGESVQLTGSLSSSSGAPIDGYEWTIVQRPAGSAARLTPSATVVDPRITVDVAGTYMLEMFARTSQQPSNCEPGTVTINVAAPDPDEIVIQMTWDTPGDADQTDNLGTDVDLHYRDSIGMWNAAPYDVYWQNPNTDWGAKGQASVDIDDRDGAGPEVISHRNATTGLFQVGVYYYSASVFGSSYATVTLSRGGVVLAEETDKYLEKADKFWHVLTLDVANDAISMGSAVRDGFPQ